MQTRSISGFVDNNIRKLCPGYFRQFFWIQADGSTDSAAADIDFIEVFRTVMDEGREEFLHSQRTAAAPDIAGDLCDFFYRPYGSGSELRSSAMGTTKT